MECLKFFSTFGELLKLSRKHRKTFCKLQIKNILMLQLMPLKTFLGLRFGLRIQDCATKYIAYTNRPFTVFEELVDLPIANGVDMGRVLHSRRSGVEIVNHISSDMKKSLVKTLILKNSKICLLVDESTRIGNKETLITFIKALMEHASRFCFHLN